MNRSQDESIALFKTPTRIVVSIGIQAVINDHNCLSHNYDEVGSSSAGSTLLPLVERHRGRVLARCVVSGSPQLTSVTIQDTWTFTSIYKAPHL